MKFVAASLLVAVLLAATSAASAWRPFHSTRPLRLGNEVALASKMQALQQRSLKLLSGFAQFRIWNGGDAPAGRYPYAVSIRGRNGEHVCGGSLIHPSWIATAAHCIDGSDGPSSNVKNPELRIGMLSESSPPDSYDKRLATKLVVHPAYNSTNALNDIGLIHFEEPSRFQPVQLSLNSNVLYDGRVLTVIGWGRTESGDKAKTLQDVDLLYVSSSSCNEPSAWDGHVLASMFCAGGGIFDACDGDSGGPILIDGGKPSKDLQVGLVSWGEAVRCGQPGKPGVYTNLSDPSIVSFLRDTIPSLFEGANHATTGQGGAADAGAPAASPPPTPSQATAAPSAVQADTPTPGGATASSAAAAIDAALQAAPNSSAQDASTWATPASTPAAPVVAATPPLASPSDPALRIAHALALATPAPNPGVITQIVDLLGAAPGMQAVDVPGFQVWRGKDLGGYGDYPCPDSVWPPGCQIDGLAADVARRCKADAACTAFVHLPKGIGKRTTPTGFLKTGAFSTTLLQDNSFAATYAATQPSPAPTQPATPVQTPVQGTAGDLAGYQAIPSRDWPDSYDYSCPASIWAGGCGIAGSLQEVGRACNSDPFCFAFVYVPRMDGTPGGVGYLKNGPLDLRLMSENPVACAYVKLPGSAGQQGYPRASVDDDSGTVDPLPETPFLSSYFLFKNRSLPENKYDFPCPDSLDKGKCVLTGTATSLAAKCDASPSCQAIVWMPDRDLSGGSGIKVSVGMLKSGTIDLADLRRSGLSHVYVKRSAASPTPGH